MSSISGHSEPIAIVGAGCRFTGSATSPSKLWELLCCTPDLSREVPPDRFNAKAFYHKDGEYHGTTDSIKAYWLDEDIKRFDASVFKISPTEAEAMDPQQRLLLEVVFEAMESAGFPLTLYSGKNVGVYSGCMTQDYETLSARDELTTSKYFATGNSRAIMANRVSYVFNFQGPSMTIDTACSSSLVALDMAILGIRAGHCAMACVTGANLMLTPEQFIVESALHMLSPSGKCHMWDARADGYARGEGFAAILIKPLSRALADGDCIEGIIREVGTNADGKTSGITMPSPTAQARLIQETYERAGLDLKNPSHRCQYFEAHGTGTAAGDPREAAAINAAFFTNPDTANDVTQPRSVVDKKLLVGSIKTVIGHTEAAAGLAGLLKVVWSMKHGIVPPNLHFETLNPSVEPHYEHLEIPTVQMPWPEPAPGQPRRASVNSFGFGGANAHAIIEAYAPEIHGYGVAVAQPRLSPTQSIVLTGQSGQATPGFSVLAQPQTSLNSDITCPMPLVISAASPKSLRDVVQTYKTFLDDNAAVDIRELSWHQYARRTGLPYRVAFSAATTSKALQELDSLLREPTISIDRIVRTKSTKSPLRILGIFTGQGAQWVAMSKSLLQQNSVYRDTIEKLDAVLKACPHPCSWTLAEQLMANVDTSRINEAAVSQPLCTAVQIALVDLVRSIGVDFHTVVGHSSGEIAAAYAAGKLSAADAIVISYYRGMVAHLACGSDGQKGGMLAAEMSEHEALSFCSEPSFDGRICVAAANAPNLVTLSGDLDSLHLANRMLRLNNKFSRLLVVDTAYHSKHMAEPAIAYIRAMREYGVSPLQGGNSTTWVSSVEGRPRTKAEDLDCQYWADNMVNRVQFHDAVNYALSQPGNEFDCAIEIGPHPALSGPATQTAKALGRTLLYASPLNRSKDSALSVADFIAFMWSNFGCVNIDLRSYLQQTQMSYLLHSRLDNVPSYPMDHTVGYWRESRISRQYHFKTDAPHELLGSRGRDDNGYEMKWRNILKLERIPWLEHHSFQGQALLPASAYCIMALDAARQCLAGRPASLVELQDVEILSGIAIDRDSPGIETLFSLNILSDVKDNATSIDATFALYSCPADGLTKMKKHASGLVHIVLDEPFMGVLPDRKVCLSETLPADPSAFYEMMTTVGLTYTGPFKALNSIQRRYGYCSATLNRLHPEDTTVLDTSPATLDACFQCAFLSYASPGDGSLWTSFLPTKISRIQFNLAAWDINTVADSSAVLTVDTYTTSRTTSFEASKASITVDISVFNSLGGTEVQVEGLTVHALANTSPEHDLELYLHTVLDLDPTDEIVQFENSVPDLDESLLAEQSCRIAYFCLQKHRAACSTTNSDPALQMLSGETEGSVDSIIRHSNHAAYLESIRVAGELSPAILSKSLLSIIDEARQVAIFRNHIGRIMKQITHRYPFMNILCLHAELTRPILTGIGNSFQSFTIGIGERLNLSSTSQEGKITLAEGVQTQNINIANKLKNQINSGILFDLVLLPTMLLSNDEAIKVLNNLIEVMKPEAFLVVVNPYATILDIETLSQCPERPLTPPHWPDILDTCGFVQQARESDQFLEAGYMLVRQFRPPMSIRTMSTVENSTVTRQLLVIRGSSTTCGNLLVPDLQDHLFKVCDHLVSRSLDEATMQDLKDCSAAIILADLDEPLISNMTQHRIDQLRALLRPNLTVLWVTCDAQSGNPEHAASFGFLRTIAAEVPTLNLQVLDLDPVQIEPQAKTISATFSQLLLVNMDTNSNSLRTKEAEIHMDKGRRLIPRLMPWKVGNDRVNALRRIVTKPTDTLRQRMDILLHLISNHSLHFEIRDGERKVYETLRDEVTIQVEYSSALPFKLGELVSGYVCIGREWATGVRMIAMSKKNSSYISCPSLQAIPIQGDERSSLMILHQFIRCLASLTAVSSAPQGSQISLVDPDVEFAMCLADIIASKELPSHKIAIMQTISGNVDKSRYANIPHGHTVHYIHPRTTTRGLKEVLPRDACVFNFNRGDANLSRRIETAVSGSSKYYSGFEMFSSEADIRRKSFLDVRPLWRMATSFIMEGPMKAPRVTKPVGIVGLNELQQHSGSVEHFHIIDWKSDREALQKVAHMAGQQILSPNKTYLMFGMTRDSGHSLCRLLLEHGAKNVLLASRNPDQSPNWIGELGKAYEANICIEKADVTSLESLVALKEKIMINMPQIGGVINGAMVLEDRVFDQMTVETWNRVLQPKTIGSANLDLVFDEPDLEFFVMTSSFAAVGGHPGQSNYAAANMYMNGLAANRRRRGLAGFAINIGVIYGLGFLQREKDHLYAGLEREGYLPISEHSLHHMFIEAIVSGRPEKKSHGISENFQPSSITTGLRRYQRGLSDPLHWHLDPRFSHFAIRQEQNNGPMTKVQRSLMEEISTLEQKEDIAEVIGNALDQRLQVLLQLPDGSIDHKNSLAGMGVDSLTAVEVRNWFQRSLNKEIPVMKILDSPSIEHLCMDLAEQILVIRAETPKNKAST
ncbi:beta-ketoacyl synthase domain-containing protein [Xylaria nigripes]|nr:beta-ketoacyl synthase domain-containing protein [Xylaria nigripes]